MMNEHMADSLNSQARQKKNPPRLKAKADSFLRLKALLTPKLVSVVKMG